ncbi:MAG: Fur family transcriptional regulator [Chloroflexota bacterium]
MTLSKSLAETLHDRGYRLTPQRMIVLEAMDAADHHISAEEIYSKAHARYPYMNVSTVYRTLELLKELGLVVETDLGSGRLVYHAAGKSHHHHLVCRKCGTVEDIDETAFERLRKDLKEQYGFDAVFEHMAVFGTCRRCSE